ncbi:hypothetical protein C7H19_24675 [Aphanothece hegewaldii CCALA 016]|uniref:3'-5' exoribonuclease Rv2179c-like domain-containing protein n=1 Tax=Aphanothece hegewaldii CCALA 016 TaxID=2107694 RepID=A0A2T1LQK4_9CHRO|nr:3'-5' exoribonuclease [Aphanothece hegewaldii]PSF28544.1 hypothetical protein C7H19_24675 [Aphanothece hegewaldii CCALA 016]
MRYWLDTEFIEDGQTIDLISVGIVAENGREYYAINLDCNFGRANDWVIKNVFPHLPFAISESFSELDQFSAWQQGFRNKKTIAKEVVEFVLSAEINTHLWSYEELIDYKLDRKPELWGYYCDYDWVVICQLFGSMVNLPKSFPMYCRDIKQWCDSLGNPKLPIKNKSHHALEDARWIKMAWEFLSAYSESSSELD